MKNDKRMLRQVGVYWRKTLLNQEKSGGQNRLEKTRGVKGAGWDGNVEDVGGKKKNGRGGGYRGGGGEESGNNFEIL